MARIETDPNYSTPTFPRATAATDPFKKEDVQSLAAAFSGHEHSTGKGVAVKLAQAVDMPDWYRSTGHTSPFASAGAGIEMYYDSTLGGVINGYTRPSGPWQGVTVSAATFTVSIGGVGNAMTIIADRSVQFQGPAVTMTALHATGSLTIDGGASVGATLHVVGATTLDAGLIAGSNELTVVTSTSVTVGHEFYVGGGTHLTGTLTCNAISCTSITASAASFFTGTVTITAGGLTSAGAITANQLTVPNSVYASGCVINNGTNNAGVFLYVNGAAGGTSGWNIIPSTIRYKSNLKSIEQALDLVKDDTLHGVYYTVSPENQEPFEAYGFLAEPWHAKAPEMISLDEEGRPQGMDYTQVVPVVFEALKEYIAATDARLAALEAA